MSVQVTFQGTNYQIPEEDDSAWADLTNYLVALSSASVGTVEQKAYRLATATPTSVSLVDDYAIGMNVSGASVVNLPTGSPGRVLVIFDASGNAAANNITINGDGGQLINGRASYIINTNYGAVQLQFGDSAWQVISSRDSTIEQNLTNTALIDATAAADNFGESVDDGESCTLTFNGNACRFIIEADTDSLECSCSSGSNIVDCLWDTGNLFTHVDGGVGVAVTKSANVITIKNRLGNTVDFKIKVLVGRIVAATDWS